MKNIAVFFDGTWNTPTDRTNVYKLYKLVDDVDQGTQRAIYIQGVGTDDSGGMLSAFKNFLGGAFGSGLSENIAAGYRALVDVYEPGDRVFLFGFSRGAYSARSLAGMIRNCGILTPEHADRTREAYNIYRDKLPADSESAIRFRKKYSQEIDIDFVGVWDTVGALGIPVQGFTLPGFKKHYEFHDTQLSRHVLAAYHALAIHEFRSAYAPTLWTMPAGLEREAGTPVEQRWFIGAHSNVGGGYRGDVLCNPSCRWIQAMAERHGLRFLSPWPVTDADYAAPPRDSYGEFVKEHKEAKKIIKKEARAVATGLCETIDPKVKSLLKKNPALIADYPALLQDLLKLPTSAP